MYICTFCNYQNKRKDLFDKHCMTKKHLENEKNNHMPAIQEEDTYDEQIFEETKYIYTCDKCSKQYKNKYSYRKHCETCCFVHSLQCPRCMKSFEHKQSKYRHIKKNNCKPVSVIHSGNVNIENLTINNNTNNTTNNTTNNINNIFINNYGNERLDYISDDMFKNILKSTQYHIIPVYIKNKHFSKDFPENHNIQYANNRFSIKTDNDWNIINSGTLAHLLYRDNGSEINQRLSEKNDLIEKQIQNEDIMQYIKQKLNYLQLEVIGEDKTIKKQIIDVIMSNSAVVK